MAHTEAAALACHRWYWRAANLGDAQAMHNLGCCYADGIGVQPDEGKAAKWFSEAAVSHALASACQQH
jgi:TPR repeat protein